MSLNFGELGLPPAVRLMEINYLVAAKAIIARVHHSETKCDWLYWRAVDEEPRYRVLLPQEPMRTILSYVPDRPARAEPARPRYKDVFTHLRSPGRVHLSAGASDRPVRPVQPDSGLVVALKPRSQDPQRQSGHAPVVSIGRAPQGLIISRRGVTPGSRCNRASSVAIIVRG